MLSLKVQIYVSIAQSFHILPTCSTWKKHLAGNVATNTCILPLRYFLLLTESEPRRAHSSLVITFRNMLHAETLGFMTLKFCCTWRGFLGALGQREQSRPPQPASSLLHTSNPPVLHFPVTPETPEISSSCDWVEWQQFPGSDSLFHTFNFS